MAEDQNQAAKKEESPLLTSLQFEYQIIQTKIDNIGNFKFVVRGWLITIYSAFVFGVFSDAISSQICIYLGLFIVFIFQFLEREQIIIQHKLSDRSKLIEASIYKLTQVKYTNQKKIESLQKSVQKKLVSVPRISGVLIAKRVYKIFKKDDSRPKGFWKSISWFFMRFVQVLKWFFSIKIYWLFWFLYLATIGMHYALNSETLSVYLKVSQNEKNKPAEINVYKNDNRHINQHRHMSHRANPSIEKLEEEMYSLVAQIDSMLFGMFRRAWRTQIKADL